MPTESIVGEKAFQFAVRVVNVYKYLVAEEKEFVLSKQFLRSGTSIGANIHEALQAQSKRDFIAKMSIALKETNESIYWLRLLRATNYLDEAAYQSLLRDNEELMRLLTSIVKTARMSG